jgi:hypothetical protein
VNSTRPHAETPTDHHQDNPPQRSTHPIQLIDLRTRVTHLMTPDAAIAGHGPRGHYLALCGAELIPTAMIEPGCGYCLPCLSAYQLSQRTINTP